MKRHDCCYIKNKDNADYYVFYFLKTLRTTVIVSDTDTNNKNRRILIRRRTVRIIIPAKT